jgi:Ubiquitin elongating factor core
MRNTQATGGQAAAQAEANFNHMVVSKFATEVALLQPDVLTDSLAFLLAACRWLTNEISTAAAVPLDSSEHDSPLSLTSLQPTNPLFALPEHLVEDILDYTIFITRYTPQTLTRGAVGSSLEPLMTFVVFLLAHPSLVHSPHLRAKLGDVLFSAFLPASERPDANTQQQQGRGSSVNESHCALLYNHQLAQVCINLHLVIHYSCTIAQCHAV